jgi:hypothetical protein
LKCSRIAAGAHQTRYIVRYDVQLAVVAGIQQFAKPALVAAQLLAAIERKYNSSANSADARHRRETVFPVCLHDQHGVRSTPNRDFH